MHVPPPKADMQACSLKEFRHLLLRAPAQDLQLGHQIKQCQVHYDVLHKQTLLMTFNKSNRQGAGEPGRGG